MHQFHWKLYIFEQDKESYQILEKEKYTSHTIALLTLFTRAFRHTRVENLLRWPVTTALGRVVAYFEGLQTTKSDNTLIMWSSQVTW